MAAETSAALDLQQELPEHVRGSLEAMADHKGRSIVVLDMRGISGFTDFMAICTGRSERHVKAVADGVQEALAKLGHPVKHVEGLGEARWVLLDTVDLVVHVFLPETREFYQLEKLWREAPMLEWGDGEEE